MEEEAGGREEGGRGGMKRESKVVVESFQNEDGSGGLFVYNGWNKDLSTACGILSDPSWLHLFLV